MCPKYGSSFCLSAADMPLPQIQNLDYAPDGGPVGTLATGPMKALGGPGQDEGCVQRGSVCICYVVETNIGI